MVLLEGGEGMIIKQEWSAAEVKEHRANFLYQEYREKELKADNGREAARVQAWISQYGAWIDWRASNVNIPAGFIYLHI